VRLHINGEPRAVTRGTVADLLRELGVPADGVAVAIDLQVVPRGAHAATILREGDRVEIIRAVGGG